MKRFAAIAAILVASILPAQAQTFNFGFSSPEGFGFSFGSGGYAEQRPAPRPHRPDVGYCMRYGAVIEFVRGQGYRNVRSYDDRGPIVRVVGEQRGRSYVVSVDSCRARIVGRAEIRETRHGRPGDRGWGRH